MDEQIQLFFVYIAAYLYSLTGDYKGKSTEWHIQFFINIYNKYKDSEHDGDCTQNLIHVGDVL